ncbi:MAG TPA: hypothetical protein VGM62_10515 [Chthoniobacterales bacterium]
MWFGFVAGDDFDDIESEGNLGVVEHSQPGERASGDLSSLESFDVFQRPALIVVGAGFDLDENEDIAVAANNIDLAARPMFEIPVKNFVTPFTQETAGDVFSAPATNMLWVTG